MSVQRSQIDGWRPTVRDRLAWGICQAALKHIATAGYRGRVEGAIRLGMQTAVLQSLERDVKRDSDKGAYQPPDGH